MSQQQATLEIEGLAVSYGGAEPAIADISFQVRPGELVAILGANGAGKTTLMQSIAGLLPARTGTVRLGDVDLAGVPAHRRARMGIGLALEGHQVIDQLTIEDNLRLALQHQRRRLGAAGVQRRIDEVYTMFDILRDRRSQVAGSLSGGQQQMLVIGRLMASDAGVLMLDEPSLGLAPAISETVYARLSELRDSGRAILLVEQNAALASEVSDHLYLLQRGRLLTSGEGSRFTREDIQRAYVSS